ncbi:MAG TPA: S1/P1 nuclease, partial [Longimicrobiaceae bacterium]
PLLWFAGAQQVAALACIVAFVPLFGLVGVLLSQAVSTMLVNALELSLARRRIGLVWWNARYRLWLAPAAAAALAAVAMMTRPAYAWDELGHRVVARIAWDQMTPQARAAAVRLLMNAPANTGLRELMPSAGSAEERGRELFIMAAVWPDIIRSRSHVGNRYAHSDWHYVDHFWEQRVPGARPVDRPDVHVEGLLLQQLPQLRATLSADASAAGDSARSIALAWVLHLVGDAHQPLHNSSRITPQDTAGDRGGNLFLLAGLYPRSNLHAFWDSLVGFSAPWSASDRDEAAYIGHVAAAIERRYPPGWARPRLLPGQMERWSMEGYRISKESVYPAWLVRGEAAPARYQAQSWAVAQPRLALAGYRLADLLNHALGSGHA